VAPQMAEPAIDHRRAIAERNVEAILDASEYLLERRSQATIAAVAKEAGVSRVTVYAHFPTRETLLEAVVERAVERATEALDAAEADSESAIVALDRVIEAGWRDLERNQGVAHAAAEQLSPEVLRRTHHAMHRRIGALVERGIAEGAFRTDVPSDWLVTVFHALIHAAGDDVRARRIRPSAALEVLRKTMRDVFIGSAQ
jgi:TetR/AcrR family transcriptional regulator, mexCD-oprJ operon repressor